MRVLLHKLAKESKNAAEFVANVKGYLNSFDFEAPKAQELYRFYELNGY